MYAFSQNRDTKILDIPSMLARVSLPTPKKVVDILKNQDRSPEETTLFMIYTGKFPPPLEKKSHARDEWLVSIQDLHAQDLSFSKNFLRSLYENSSLWTNDDDFAFYEFNGTYKNRNFRVIFHRSRATDETSGNVMSYYDYQRPFEQIFTENTPVRICWY